MIAMMRSKTIGTLPVQPTSIQIGEQQRQGHNVVNGSAYLYATHLATLVERNRGSIHSRSISYIRINNMIQPLLYFPLHVIPIYHFHSLSPLEPSAFVSIYYKLDFVIAATNCFTSPNAGSLIRVLLLFLLRL